MISVCRSSVDWLRFLSHAFAVEIGNLAHSFFDLLGLDLGSTRFVLANALAGVAYSATRGWVHDGPTVGKGHPQQILVAVSPSHLGRSITTCVHRSKDHGPTVQLPGIRSWKDTTSYFTAPHSRGFPYGRLRSGQSTAFSARGIREVGLTQQRWSDWPNHGLVDRAILRLVDAR